MIWHCSYTAIPSVHMVNYLIQQGLGKTRTSQFKTCRKTPRLRPLVAASKRSGPHRAALNPSLILASTCLNHQGNLPNIISWCLSPVVNMSGGIYLLLNSITLTLPIIMWGHYLVWTTLVGSHVTVSRSDYFSVIQKTYFAVCGGPISFTSKSCCWTNKQSMP